MITVLCGGVGGSRFVRALSLVVPQARITAVINTADDDEFHGLYVSPDPDIVTYALAGVVDSERGWGFANDTFRWNEHLRRFGRETWFQIGDRDLATHLHRTRHLSEGASLSEVTADIGRSFGIQARLLPMSDERVRTIVETDAGELPFQRYLVERHAQDVVRSVRFEGIEASQPAPGVLEAIRDAEAIFIAPSNPVASIGPILAVPGIREAIQSAEAPCIAISPIIDGKSLQPPAGEMMAGLGHTVDVLGVAKIYDGLIDMLIIDEADEAHALEIASLGMRAFVTPTLMLDDEASRELALVALEAASVDLTSVADAR